MLILCALFRSLEAVLQLFLNISVYQTLYIGATVHQNYVYTYVAVGFEYIVRDQNIFPYFNILYLLPKVHGGEILGLSTL